MYRKIHARARNFQSKDEDLVCKEDSWFDPDIIHI